MEGQVLFLYNGSDPSVMIELALAITNQSGKPHDYQLQLTPTEEGSTFKRLKEADYSLWLEDYSLGELWIKNILS